jgi:hypothetical protein
MSPAEPSLPSRNWEYVVAKARPALCRRSWLRVTAFGVSLTAPAISTQV